MIAKARLHCRGFGRHQQRSNGALPCRRVACNHLGKGAGAADFSTAKPTSSTLASELVITTTPCCRSDDRGRGYIPNNPST